MTILPYHKSYKMVWNQLISESPNSTFLFHRDFMEYHQDRFQDASVLVFQEDELVAALPANHKNEFIYSHQGLSYGGLVYHADLDKKQQESVLENVFAHLRKQRFQYLIYKELPDYYKLSPTNFTFFSSINTELIAEETSSVINLQQEKNYQTRRTRMLKRALNTSIQVEVQPSLEEFWQVLSTNLMTRYQTKPVHTLSEINELASRFPHHIELFQAKLNGEVVGGILVFKTKQCIHAQYIAANKKGKTYGALDLVVDTIINQFRNSHHYFSLGISNDRKVGGINQGLKDWKDGFGSKDFTHRIYKITL